MKKRAIILLTILVSSISIQQTVGQNNPRASNEAFRSCLQAMQSTNNESMRLDYALNYFVNRQSTMGQLQRAFRLLYSERFKFDLGVAAYPNIRDKEKFFAIYDNFNNLSWAIQLYHYTQAQGEWINTPGICSASDLDFQRITKNIKDQWGIGNEQLDMAKEQVENWCFTIEQMKQIVAIFKMDEQRLEIIKFMYDFSDEQRRFYEFGELLSFSSAKSELNRFLAAKN